MDHQPHQRSVSHDQHRVLDLDAEVFGAVEDLLERFADDIELEPRATRTVWAASPAP